MFAVCRITTVVAMLLHSLFGCSLHHAVSCDSHAHGLCNNAGSAGDHVTFDAKNDCCDSHFGHDHGCEADDSCAGEVGSGSELNVAHSCLGCQSGPCDGNSPGCHSDASCSFVPASGVVFHCDATSVGSISYDIDLSAVRVRAFAWQYDRQRPFSGAESSLSRCASLCTWRI